MKKLFFAFFVITHSLVAEMYISPTQLLQNALEISQASDTLIDDFIKTGEYIDTPDNRRIALIGFFVCMGKCSIEDSNNHKKNMDRLISLFDILDYYFKHNPSFMHSDLCLFLFPCIADFSPQDRPSLVDLLNNVDLVLNKKSDLMEAYADVFLENQEVAPRELLALLYGKDGAANFLKKSTNRLLIEVGYCVAAGALLEKLNDGNFGSFVLFNDMLSLYQTSPEEKLLSKFFMMQQ